MSWWSVLLVEETGVPGENHRPVASHWQTLSHNVVSSTPRLSGLVLTTLMVIGIDCTGRYKSNYHTITTTTAPYGWRLYAVIAIKFYLNAHFNQSETALENPRSL
jgi:hypothetical protein